MGPAWPARAARARSDLNASNLVLGDDNGTADVFARNLTTGVTTMVSLHPDGSGLAGPSSQGAIRSERLQPGARRRQRDRGRVRAQPHDGSDDDGVAASRWVRPGRPEQPGRDPI